MLLLLGGVPPTSLYSSDPGHYQQKGQGEESNDIIRISTFIHVDQ